MGGRALSVNLAKKRKMYRKIQDICQSYGIVFHTCGCKETRLQDEGFSLSVFRFFGEDIA